MTKLNNHIFPALVAIVLLSVLSCGRQSFVASRPFAEDAVVYSAALDSDSLFVVSDMSLLKLGNGPFKLNVYACGPDGSVELPYALRKDLDLMDDQAAPVLSGSVQLKTRAGSYTSLTLLLGRLEPGFYQVALGDSLKFNIGVNPELIQSHVDAPEDFDAFWERTLAELA